MTTERITENSEALNPGGDENDEVRKKNFLVSEQFRRYKLFIDWTRAKLMMGGPFEPPIVRSVPQIAQPIG